MRLFKLKSAGAALVVALGLGAVATTVNAAVHVPWSLLGSDPYCVHRPGCHEQMHRVTLFQGTTYVIDMRSSQFDSYLLLEDSAGWVLAQNDDGGGNLNARIIWTAQYTGTYTIVATSFHRGATGSYTLTVSP